MAAASGGSGSRTSSYLPTRPWSPSRAIRARDGDHGVCRGAGRGCPPGTILRPRGCRRPRGRPLAAPDRLSRMSDADATIAALRSGFDELATLVSGFGDDDLARPSGAAEWDVSQVLSHLGSGAEIAQNTLQVSLEGKPNPGMDFNRPRWARYGGASPRERADWFLRANEALTQSYESLSEETRQILRVDLGFLPAPVDVATAAGFR